VFGAAGAKRRCAFRIHHKRSARIIATYGPAGEVPGHEAYRTDLATAALASLKKRNDVYGKHWHKLHIRVTPGGK
jgi:hypothetical protein